MDLKKLRHDSSAKLQLFLAIDCSYCGLAGLRVSPANYSKSTLRKAAKLLFLGISDLCATASAAAPTTAHNSARAARDVIIAVYSLSVRIVGLMAPTFDLISIALFCNFLSK